MRTSNSLWTLSLALLLACGGAESTSDTSGSASAATSGGQDASSDISAALDAALAGAHRSEANRARDGHRHPKETLMFFGLRPEMTVVEISPGRAAWYTEVLAPVLRERGQLIAAIPDPAESEYGQLFMARVEASPEVFSQVRTAIWAPPSQTSLGAPGSADMVLTFRNTHGWINRGTASEAYASFFEVLKPGGILGVVQHRADEGADPAETAQGGYVPEATLIELAVAAGFALDGRSDINANPRDDHDHPEGVWTLPPVLRLGDVDRETYVGIGESDRVTLRFRKPGA